jgi:hypothetical protein
MKPDVTSADESAPVVAPVSTGNESVSVENRKRLQELYRKGGYSSVKFWVSPNSLVSEDECIAEVADALESFQKDKASGELKPVGDDVTY